MSVEYIVALVSGALVVVSLVCVCRLRAVVSIESDAVIDAQSAVELSPK